MFKRIYKIEDEPNESLFLFGARQTGKTTIVKERFPDAIYIDLLDTDLLRRLSRRPALLRETLLGKPDGSVVVIDEIQQLPILLNEVHWLISNKGMRFVLSGSSARKLKRSGTNTLGGRALPCTLYPLVSAEIPDFDIVRACNHGMMPRNYLSDNPRRLLQAYVDIYLKEEIKAEALVRNLGGFSSFLEAAARTDGEMVKYENIAQDCNISANTAKEYFSILTDTLIGYMIPAFTRVQKRRVVQAPRFYFFDVGIVNHLLHRNSLEPGSPEFGHAFEHLIVQEVVAYLGYTHSEKQMTYWRTYTGTEVDIVIGDAELAIEVKSATEIVGRHLKGLLLFKEEFPDARCIVVSLDKMERTTASGVEILLANNFLRKMWGGELV